MSLIPGQETAYRLGRELTREQFADGTISGDCLRTLLLGSLGPDDGRKRPGGPPPRVLLRGVTIIGVAKEEGGCPLVDLRQLTGAGGPLPHLSLTDCVIQGVLDLGGTHISSLSLEGCSLDALHADGAQIDGDCILHGLLPRAPRGLCRVQLLAARIDGSLYLRGSKLRAMRLDATQVGAPGGYQGQFALTIAGSEVAGRVHLNGGFEAWGGVSLFQASIRNGLLVEADLLAAHRLDTTKVGERPVFNASAMDARAVKIGGSLIWGGSSGIDGTVWGSVSLIEAHVAGDVVLERLRWRSAAPWSDGDGEAPQNPPGSDAAAETGGIDARYVRIDGQLRVHDGCLIARRPRPMAGLNLESALGPALDCWKGTFGLGVRLDRGATFLGPVYLNACSIERHVFVASNLLPHTAARPRHSPYHVALDISDSRVRGRIEFNVPRAAGRVSLLRAAVEGTLEIERLGFEHRGIADASYVGSRLPDDLDAEELGTVERTAVDETSILDMQDLTVTGGVNLKRRGLRIDCSGGSLPASRFIVDMRGMSCGSWDDADATCWDGLLDRDETRRTPWRLRFDGVVLGRLDGSNQTTSLSRRALRLRGWRLRWTRAPLLRWSNGQGLGFAKLGSTDPFKSGWWPWAMRLVEDHGRTYTTLSRRETIDHRLEALGSFHQNRQRPPRGVLLRMGHAFHRWLFQRSWRRRELIPPVSPQPYEAFARAYIARGELDVGIAIARRKMWRSWRRRLRLLLRAWEQNVLPVGVPAAIILGLLAWSGSVPPAWFWIAFGLGVVPGPFFAAVAATAVFGIGFGFGLASRRASATLIAFVLFTALATPVLVGAPPTTARTLAPQLLYGVDKLIPGLRQHTPMFAQSSTGRSGAEPHAGTPENTQASAFPAPPDAATARVLDHLYDIVGTLLLSLALLTFSGLLRRDLER